MNRITLIAAATMVVLGVSANNLRVGNLSIKGRDKYTAYVKFDISWENSWRHGVDGDSLYFHDAAWVFFKVRREGGSD